MPKESEINFRKGTALQWATSNPVLDLGEPGFESDTLKFKVGDGTTAWNLLPYVHLDGGIVGSGGGGGSPSSSSSSAQVTTPAQITDFSATPSNQPDNGVEDRIVLNWTAPSDNGSAITGYSIDYSTDNTSWNGISQFFLGTIEPGMTFSSLTPGTTYYFRIRASNANGNAAWSASDSAVMPKPGCTDSGAGNYDSAATYDVGTCTPDQITDFSSNQSNQPDNGVEDRIVLNWTTPSGNGSAITGQSVEYGTDGFIWSVLSASAEPGITWSSGTPGTVYYFRGRASNANGEGAWSSPSNIVFPKPGCVYSGSSNYDSTATYNNGTCLPSQITDFSATSSNQPDNGYADRIVLNWTTPSDNGSAITNYSLEYSTDDSNWYSINTTIQPGMTWSDGTPGTTYYFRIRASNANGDAAWSASDTAVLPKPGCMDSSAGNYDSAATYSNGACVPDQITDLSATPSNQPDNGFSDRIVLTWTNPSGNGSAVTGYSMEYSTDDSSWSVFGGIVESGMTFSAFSAGQTYYFRVRASNANGDAAWSASANAVFPKPGCNDSGAPNYDSTATYNNGTCRPDQIADFSASPSNYPDNGVADRIVLNWTNPSGNGSSITGYSAEYSTDNTNWTSIYATIESGMTWAGGTSGTTYYFRVRATNANGDADWSASDSAVFPKPGCTDSGANNYDSTATYDNGSCS